MAALGGYRSFTCALLCMALYNAMYILYDIMGSLTSPTMHPTVVVMAVETLKLAMSVLLYMTNTSSSEGQPLLQGSPRPWSVDGLLATAQNMAIPAVCYATTDSLNLLALGYYRVSLAHYAALHQLGILVTAALTLAGSKSLGTLKVVAVLLLCCGGMMNAFDSKFQLSGSFPSVGATSIVILSTSVSAFGCVANEYVYKRVANADINYQNIVLYCETICLLTLFQIGKTFFLTWDVGELGHGINLVALSIIVVKSSLGIVVSRLLYYGSAMMKQFACALHIPIEVVVAHLTLGSSCGLSTFTGALLVGFSTFVYFFRPPQVLADTQTGKKTLDA